MKPRCVGLVTTSRADYGIYRPVIAEIRRRPELDLIVFAGGAHLIREVGDTIKEIEADGVPIAERVEMPLGSDDAEGIASWMGRGTESFAHAYARHQLDLLIVLGDRAEMHAAASAAVPFGIPMAHIHGGEITEGAIDDALRHSITKMSHLHFPTTESHARRIRQMGEEPWRVTACGAPSLDNLATVPRLDRAELQRRCGLAWDRPPLLVTFHPATLEAESIEAQVGELTAALTGVEMPIVFTLPNVDAGGRQIADALRRFIDATPGTAMVRSLGTAGYFSLMAEAAAMVGNSSSGLVEAPSFELPVVNIGIRQKGRTRAANVIDVGGTRAEIRAGIDRALDPAFRSKLKGLVNPYGDGQAARRIADRLVSVELGPRLLHKTFVDWEEGP